MRVVRSRVAERDLLDIWTFIAKDNLVAADKVLDALEATTMRIGEFPEIGRLRPDISPEVRSFRSGQSYLVLYRILNDHVEIVRYAHGRRNLADII